MVHDLIPILYAADETSFTHNGIGLLTDCVSCTVTEERNGAFELSMQYPMSGAHYADIQTDTIIKAVPFADGEPQLFRVYQKSDPIGMVSTISAEHVSYELARMPVLSFAYTGLAYEAINQALKSAVIPTGFTAWSDISVSHQTQIPEPVSVRSCLGGKEGSILDVWGGEYEWDNYTVKLHAHRGTKSEVIIEYGKNLTSLTQDKNIGETYTGIVPFVKKTVDGSDIYTTLPEKYIQAKNAGNFARPRLSVMDFTSQFTQDEEITVDALRQKAQEYVEVSDLGIPKVNLTVSFAPTWQTDSGSDAPAGKVNLCDTVTVRFLRLGVDATAKVIKTVYNVLLDRYDSIELGDAKSNFVDTVGNLQNTTQRIEDLEVTVSGVDEIIADAIFDATETITGAKGGCVVTRFDKDNKPYEILIMDTDDINTAKQVWRWNIGGFGHSSNGINGPYDTAITMDGKIVGKFVYALEIVGKQIIAGRIESADKSVYFDLDKNEASVTKIIGGDGVTIDIGTVSKNINGSVQNFAGCVISRNGSNKVYIGSSTNYANIQALMADQGDLTLLCGPGNATNRSTRMTLYSNSGGDNGRLTATVAGSGSSALDLQKTSSSLICDGGSHVCRIDLDGDITIASYGGRINLDGAVYVNGNPI